jgi:hypothetical protein
MRKLVHNAMMKRIKNQPNNILKLTNEDLLYLFNLYDDVFFDGYITDALEDEGMDFCIRFGKATSAGGSCSITLPYKAEIMISRPVFAGIFKEPGIESEVNGGLACRDALECMMLTLEHEITHLILRMFFPDLMENQEPHGAVFLRTVRNCFGHRNGYHELL